MSKFLINEGLVALVIFVIVLISALLFYFSQSNSALCKLTLGEPGLFCQESCWDPDSDSINDECTKGFSNCDFVCKR